MIPKKVETKIRGKSKSKSFADLVNYIVAPFTVNQEEKLLYTGSRGFLFEEFKIQREEMLALVNANTRSPNPVMHYLFSWPENEQPTRDQFEELIDIFCEETGLNNNQIIWGAHQNTKNIHIHLAVNKIDLDSEKITRVNNNLDIEILHKVVAKVEHQQGWESTPNCRYVCDEHGNVMRATSPKLNKSIKQKVYDYEVATGEKSAIRIAQEQASVKLKNAKSWEELHKELQNIGIKFEKKGSGAILFVGQTAVKASSVGREFSLKNMEKRLGKFKENKDTVPLFTDTKIKNFMEEGKLNEQRDAHRKGLQFPQSDTGKTSERGTSSNHDRVGERTGEHAKPSIIYPQVSTQRGLFTMPRCHMVRGKQGLVSRRRREKNRRREIESLLPNLSRALGKVDNFMRWRGAWAVSDTNIDLWFRYQREKLKAYQQKIVQKMQKQFGISSDTSDTSGTLGISGTKQKTSTEKFIDWLKVNDFSKQLDEWRYERNKNYITNEHTKDILEVKKHELLDEKLSDLVLAGWKKISLYGNDFFKMLAVKLSFKHKLEITNPELQEMIAQEKDVTRIADMDEVKTFRLYHEAVQADRYRVTCMKIKEDGTKLAFILDKQYQVNGFTPEQLEERLKEMLKIQSKGNNIYLTPISDKKHHILVDDMDSNKVSEFLVDGYSPAALIESSPNNYQAIISIPKLGTAYDRVVGNKVAERLNKKYGDEKLSGCIHPHRVPGFENLKANHRKEDGTYPKVQLIKSEQVECAKIFRLSQQINDEHVASEKRRLAKPKEFTGDTKQYSLVSSNTAYFQHLDNIKQHLDVQDKSRVDAMIALRMRATGHSQGSIEQAILECAPTWRSQNERKSWNDYAKRTANYAFSFAGDRDLERNLKYIEHWQRLEGGRMESRKRMR